MSPRPFSRIVPLVPEEEPVFSVPRSLLLEGLINLLLCQTAKSPSQSWFTVFLRIDFLCLFFHGLSFSLQNTYKESGNTAFLICQKHQTVQFTEKVTPSLLVKFAITTQLSATVRLCSPSSFSRSFVAVDRCVLPDHPVRATAELHALCTASLYKCMLPSFQAVQNLPKLLLAGPAYEIMKDTKLKNK